MNLIVGLQGDNFVRQTLKYMEKNSMKKTYVSPISECVEIFPESVLCGSPVNPGYGGGEDMEDGGDL